MCGSSVVVVCSECGEFWDEDADSPRCTDSDHTHQTFEVHVHLSPVTLPGGSAVVAASFNPKDPYAREKWPHYGLYFDPRWDPPWPHDHVAWPDLGVPGDADELGAKLRLVLARSRAGDQIEIGCLGGHGRTGTALAILACLDGIPAPEAVAWVRANYCDDAVETGDQETFVRTVAPKLS